MTQWLALEPVLNSSNQEWEVVSSSHHQDRFRFLKMRWKPLIDWLHSVSLSQRLPRLISLVIKMRSLLPISSLNPVLMMRSKLHRMQLQHLRLLKFNSSQLNSNQQHSRILSQRRKKKVTLNQTISQQRIKKMMTRRMAMVTKTWTQEMRVAPPFYERVRTAQLIFSVRINYE